MMNVQVNQVIATCMQIGIMVSINQRLDAETINLVAEELYDNFVKTAVTKFAEKYGKKPIVIDVVIGDGARKLC